jgi:hypothetical protein
MGVSAPSRPLTPFRGLGCDKAALSRFRSVPCPLLTECLSQLP